MGELERIWQLEKENKALKEELKTTQDIAFELTESLRKEGIELGKTKQSRDELLAFLNQCKRIIGKHLIKKQWFDNIWWSELDEIIQKAEAFKC